MRAGVNHPEKGGFTSTRAGSEARSAPGGVVRMPVKTMMNPYRNSTEEPSANARTEEPDDERTILWLAFFIGLLPPIVALAHVVVWGAEPTAGLLLCVLAAVGLVRRKRKIMGDSPPS